VTVVDNHPRTEDQVAPFAVDGGGIAVIGGTATVRNSLVAFNAALGGPDCSGALGSWITACSPAPSAAPGSAARRTWWPSIHASKGALEGHGTFVHPLLADSPAVDVASSRRCPRTDQRGITRPQDGNADGVAACDIGAYER
jgi:hypothetical protein